MLQSKQIIIFKIPVQRHYATQAGSKTVAIFLYLTNFIGIKTPDTAVVFQQWAGIDADGAGCAVEFLAGIGIGSKGYVHIPPIIKGQGLGNVLVHAVCMIVGEDNFLLTAGYQVTWGELVAIDDQLGAEIKVPLVDPHPGTISALPGIAPKAFDDIRPSIAVGIAQSNDGFALIGKTRLDVDVAIVVDGDVTRPPRQTIHYYRGLKTIRQE